MNRRLRGIRLAALIVLAGCGGSESADPVDSIVLVDEADDNDAGPPADEADDGTEAETAGDDDEAVEGDDRALSDEDEELPEESESDDDGPIRADDAYARWSTADCVAQPLPLADDDSIDSSLVRLDDCGTLLNGEELTVNRLPPSVIDDLIAGGGAADSPAAGCWKDSTITIPADCTYRGIAAFEISPDADLGGAEATIRIDLTPYENLDSPECQRLLAAELEGVVCDTVGTDQEKDDVDFDIYRYVPDAVPNERWQPSGVAEIRTQTEVAEGTINHFSIHVLVAVPAEEIVAPRSLLCTTGAVDEQDTPRLVRLNAETGEVTASAPTTLGSVLLASQPGNDNAILASFDFDTEETALTTVRSSDLAQLDVRAVAADANPLLYDREGSIWGTRAGADFDLSSVFRLLSDSTEAQEFGGRADGAGLIGADAAVSDSRDELYLMGFQDDFVTARLLTFDLLSGDLKFDVALEQFMPITTSSDGQLVGAFVRGVTTDVVIVDPSDGSMTTVAQVDEDSPSLAAANGANEVWIYDGEFGISQLRLVDLATGESGPPVEPVEFLSSCVGG